MKIKQYLYGNDKIDLKVKVFILDEQDNMTEVIEIPIQSNYRLYELKTNEKELNRIFEKVIARLIKDYGIRKKYSRTYSYDLEMIADCTQDTPHGKNWIKLLFKISDS